MNISKLQASPVSIVLKAVNMIFMYLDRWLDEGDGENGIEQTLALSEILVSDEKEAETEDLPGNKGFCEIIYFLGARNFVVF